MSLVYRSLLANLFYRDEVNVEYIIYTLYIQLVENKVTYVLTHILDIQSGQILGNKKDKYQKIELKHLSITEAELTSFSTCFVKGERGEERGRKEE